jgi:hypothetical protein
VQNRPENAALHLRKDIDPKTMADSGNMTPYIAGACLQGRHSLIRADDDLLSIL